MVIDGHEQHLPASSADGVAAISRDPMARPFDPPQLLGIDMQQIAGGHMLVALNRGSWLKVLPSRQSGTSQDSTDGALRHAQAGGDARLRQPLPPQVDDRQGRARRNGPRALRRTRRAVAETGRAVHQIAAQPFADGGQTDPVHLRCSSLG